MARSRLVELFTRVIEFVKKDNIYTNGDDNNYPERIERVVNNSVTAKSCANRVAQYIIGGGFEEEFIVNKQKNLTNNDILRSIAESVKYHKGFYLHKNYDFEGKVSYLDVLPYKNCRISKKDDVGYDGAIYYAENWANKGFSFNVKSKKAKWFYPFNKNIDVINAQRKKDCSNLRDEDTEDEKAIKLIKQYRGQVDFINFEPSYIYPLAYIDACYNDADSEYRTSIFKNTSLRNGFIDKMVATVLKSESKKEQEEIERDLQGLLGVEEAGNIIVFETELDADGKLTPVIEFTPVKSNLNDKLFAYTEESIKGNILMAYNVHPSLVISSHALYGSSGEEIKQIKIDFQNSVIDIINKIESIFNEMYPDRNNKIKLLINGTVTDN